MASGCANKDPIVSRLEGAEPQRLSFGTPAAVQKAFADQMRVCWFNGPSAPLSGYQYNLKPVTLETAEGLVELPQIAITSGDGPRGQTFLVQFYPFNNNTLISTRNLSFPVELAARLKRDVETWVFGRGACSEPAPNSAPAIAQTSASPVQQASASGWSTEQIGQAVR